MAIRWLKNFGHIDRPEPPVADYLSFVAPRDILRLLLPISAVPEEGNGYFWDTECIFVHRLTAMYDYADGWIAFLHRALRSGEVEGRMSLPNRIGRCERTPSAIMVA